MQGGILLSGSSKKKQRDYAWPELRECVRTSDLPVLFTNVSTSESVRKLSKYVAKLNADDPSRTDAVVKQYSQYIDYDAILDIAKK